MINHGVFTFGETAEISYKRMIDLVGVAEDYIQHHRKVITSESQAPQAPHLENQACMEHIQKHFLENEFPCVLKLCTDEMTQKFLSHSNAKALSQVGPVSPDHIMRTRQYPLFVNVRSNESFIEDFQTALDEYQKQYTHYFQTQSTSRKKSYTMYDSFPRVILIPGLGLISIATNEKECEIIANIYTHTMKIILDAESIGQYQSFEDTEVFDMEYRFT